MNTLGPLLGQSLARNIGGNASRSELDKLSEPIKKLVSHYPSAKDWLGAGLEDPSFPSSKVTSEDKALFVKKLIRYASGDCRCSGGIHLCPFPCPSMLTAVCSKVSVGPERRTELCEIFGSPHEALTSHMLLEFSFSSSYPRCLAFEGWPRQQAPIGLSTGGEWRCWPEKYTMPSAQNSPKGEVVVLFDKGCPHTHSLSDYTHGLSRAFASFTRPVSLDLVDIAIVRAQEFEIAIPDPVQSRYDGI